MSVKNDIYNILTPLNIPVKHLSYSGSAVTYIVYRRIDRDRQNYSDDEPESEIQTWQIDIFSKVPIEDSFIDQVNENMESNDFEWALENGPEYIEDITEYWVSIRYILERKWNLNG
jgi:hypothetical protein